MAGFQVAWTQASARVRQVLTSAGAADAPSLSHFLAPGESPEEVWSEVSGVAAAEDDHDMIDFANLLTAAKRDSRTRARDETPRCRTTTVTRGQRQRKSETARSRRKQRRDRAGSVPCTVP